MRRVIVDASVAVKWVIDEAGSDRAALLLDGRVLHAPRLLFIEAANALWAIARRGAIPAEGTDEALSALLEAPLRHEAETPELVARAHRLACALDHPVYDCVYMALAIELGAPVVTADARFLRAVDRDADLSRLAVALSSVEA